jgi:4-hydroxybenzoate polyprenyltransferase
MFEKLRAFADIGRTQGITTTASVAIVGALTSTVTVEWYHIVYFTVLAALAHTAINTYIALGDVELDSETYVPSRNPVASRILSKTEAMRFFYGATILCAMLLLALIFLKPTTWSLAAALCFVPSYVWLIWYGWKGKHYVVSYDFSFSISYGFFVFFGVFAVGGLPTVYTWIFIGAVFFVATAFAQWENGLKDADADRSVGVRSFAVLMNVRNNEKLRFMHPYFLYGVLLKAGFIVICFFAFLNYPDIRYLLFVLLYGVPSQAFILYRFLTKKKPIDHRRTILLDVTFTGILGYSVIIGKTGVVPIVLLVLYLIFGYLIGSLIQSRCEFKFSRFTKVGVPD